MRRPHSTIILLLALLFVGQTVATAMACEQIEEVADHRCCGETVHQPAADDCGCYDVPEQPATTEPVIQVQPTPTVAALTPAADSPPGPAPRRFTTFEALYLPAPPPLRAHDVRAPPILW